jgi:hypothetical protein
VSEKCAALRRGRIAAGGQTDCLKDQTIGLEPERRCRKPHDALHEQGSAGEQHERERNLSDHEALDDARIAPHAKPGWRLSIRTTYRRSCCASTSQRMSVAKRRRIRIWCMTNMDATIAPSMRRSVFVSAPLAAVLLSGCIGRDVRTSAASAPRPVIVQGAMDVEIRKLVGALAEVTEEHLGGWTFWSGTLDGYLRRPLEDDEGNVQCRGSDSARLGTLPSDYDCESGHGRRTSA